VWALLLCTASRTSSTLFHRRTKCREILVARPRRRNKSTATSLKTTPSCGKIVRVLTKLEHLPGQLHMSAMRRKTRKTDFSQLGRNSTALVSWKVKSVPVLVEVVGVTLRVVDPVDEVLVCGKSEERGWKVSWKERKRLGKMAARLDVVREGSATHKSRNLEQAWWLEMRGRGKRSRFVRRVSFPQTATRSSS
jgi:hypothetical protein